MGKLEAFYIELWEGINIFYPGSTVEGKVIVQLREPLKARNVRITINGGASVHWSEQRTVGTGENRHTETVNYDGSETYMHHRMILFGSETESTHLPAGRTEYPFQFLLPPVLPSSFEGSVGHIRYLLSATIDRPWKFDHHHQLPFSVLGIQDLNLDPSAGFPAEAMNSKEVGCCCCPDGTISVQVRIPRRGYVPGELIPINADISNDSTTQIVCVEMYMKQYTHFQATNGSKSNDIAIPGTMIAKPGIGPNGHQIWSEEQGDIIQVPSLPPMLLPCSIIDIHYYLMFKVVPSGISSTLKLEVPITIGTVPLRVTMPNFQPTQQNSATAPPLPTQLSLEYPDLPPPSYEDCTTGSGDIPPETEHSTGVTNFTPKYSFYGNR